MIEEGFQELYLELKEKRVTDAEIAVMLGISLRGLNKRKKKYFKRGDFFHTITGRPKGSGIKPENFREWYLEQKQLKKTNAEIAKELFISDSTLRHWRKQEGV
jgi:DNA-binding CsgD family transcriptional regulator